MASSCLAKRLLWDWWRLGLCRASSESAMNLLNQNFHLMEEWRYRLLYYWASQNVHRSHLGQSSLWMPIFQTVKEPVECKALHFLTVLC